MILLLWSTPDDTTTGGHGRSARQGEWIDPILNDDEEVVILVAAQRRL